MSDLEKFKMLHESHSTAETLQPLENVKADLEETIEEINKIIFKFLWRGQDRVVRTAIINLHENGGLRVQI